MLETYTGRSQKKSKLVKLEKTLGDKNREAQQAYRERHGENLRKARRVATALMGLRSRKFFAESSMFKAIRALEDFFTADEMKRFADEIKKIEENKKPARGRKK